MAEKLYKLIEQSTTGWTELGGRYVSLTKDQCDSYIKELIGAGTNPNDLRAVDTNDNRFKPIA